MTKDEAKDRLKIPEIWSRYNLPGKPAKICASPFREDRHPSFSVSPDGKLWNDFATGEGGDAIDFLARLTGDGTFTRVTAFVELAASIFGDPSSPKRHEERVMGSPGRVSPRPKVQTPEPEPEALKSALDAFRPPTQEECQIIAATRGLSAAAPFLAGQIGTLLIGEVCGFNSWILTDEKRRIAEARRMDGHEFPAHNSLGERKAHTLRGSKKDWPVGILPRLENHHKIEKILLVEGGPDYLAAIQLVVVAGSDALAVAFLGARAGRKIHPDALKLFEHRRVRIFEHADQSGEAGAEQWDQELKEVCAQVDRSVIGQIDERAHDLNDLVRLVPERLQVQLFKILLP